MPALKKVNKEENVEAIVYVGPNCRVLTKGTTYIGGTPKHIEENLKAFPTLKKMFVPVSKLSETLQQLEDKESAESAFFNATKQYFLEVESYGI